MASLASIRTALATALGGISGLRVSPDFTATVNPPAAIIMPQTRVVEVPVALGGSKNFMMRIMLLGSYTEDTSSQALIDGYLSTTGPSSIMATLEANPTLSGACDYCNVDSVTGYGLLDWAGQQYLGTQFLLTVAASTP